MSKPAARDTIVKLIVAAGQATPGPPVGPALGSRGVKAIDFCREFNARTQHIVIGTPLPCRITVRADRTFKFDIRTPLTSWFLLNAANVQPNKKGIRKGANSPGKEVVGNVSLKHVYEIAKIKLTELRLQGTPIRSVCKSIIQQTLTMGIKVLP